MSYTEYADVEEIFPSETLEGANRHYAYEFRSGVFVNDGALNFTFKPFPVEAQLSPINAFYLTDGDGDQKVDILSGGNFYEVTIERGRYDADYGTLLRNTGEGNFAWVPNTQTGLYLDGQICDMAPIEYQGQEIIAITRNKQPLQLIRKKPQEFYESHEITTTASADAY